ncbi:MAG: phosphate ABC transporter substrate-binding protein, PhoT family [Chitinophagaceae bacterium]|nr:MAG: phosphate ABC transporter substrate-binding protein, PhoT family [Chitinophagaceae bacterium]
MMNADCSRKGVNNLMMMIFIVMMVAIAGCGDGKGAGRGLTGLDSITGGTIRISVDESFKPVIDSQIKVFESLYPDAKINVDYKPEAECLRDLTNDSVRMIIVTRAITRDEEKIITDRYQFKPAFGPLAVDAVAVIVNNKSEDSLFKISEIQDMVKGTSEKYKYKVLLDGTSATSTVRFVRDSLLKGGTLSKNVFAAPNSKGVIEYVSRNNDAIGMIGVSWIGNQDDTAQLSFLKNVKMGQLECRGCTGTYVQPYQANIALGRYPMVRPLYYVLKENYKGLGSGFTNFLVYEKGQLIFRRAYLVPARMSFEVRNMSITN